MHFARLSLLTPLLLGCSTSPDSVSPLPRPLLRKLGTVDTDLVETTPVVFRGRLWRFESVRERYPGNALGKPYFRFVDAATGGATPPFAEGRHLGCALVEGDAVHVFGVPAWGASRIDVFRSGDLKTWTTQTAFERPGWGIYNTSVARGPDGFVMAIELGAPPDVVGVGFTMRFATSKDLRTWVLLPEDRVFAKDRYTACPTIRWLDGFWYMVYLEARPGPAYELWIVRSPDLVRWEPSPLNPILRFSDDDRRIASPHLSADRRATVAAAVDRNNSDVDFVEFGGKVVLYYSWGDQAGVEFLARAEYDGSLREMLTGYFPSPSK